MNKLTFSLFPSLVTLLFFTNSIFLWPIDDPSLNSSFILRFVEGIMRSYHSSNQHKHFSKSNIINALRHCSPRLKKNLTFHDPNNYKNGKHYSLPHLFSIKHTFRSKYGFVIYTEKRKEEKIWIGAIILVTQNSMNKNNTC